MPTGSHGPPGPSARPSPAAPGAQRVGGVALATPKPLPPRLLQALTLALLVAATCLAFAGALRNGWLFWDDPEYVTAQPRVAAGWKLGNAIWFLSHPHSGNWHPLTSWSHMLDVQLFGLGPVGPHAMNVALHALNGVLLLLVLYGLTRAWWRSAAVAALFALHPLRVESVAWIAERKDVLSGLCFLLTLDAYRRWAERPGRGRYALVMAFLALGLMAKPMLVSLPFVLVLLDVWPLGRLPGAVRRTQVRAETRPLGGLIVEKWPLIALAAGAAVITYVVQRGYGAMIPTGVITPARRLGNALLSYARYVEKTVWPRGLCALYPYAPRTDWLAVAVAAVAVAAVTVAVLRAARRRPWLAVGWLWYLGMLLPVIGLVQVGTQGYADRYTYLPTIGLLVAVVWLVGEWVARTRAARAAAVVGLVLALTLLSVATARQVGFWRDTETLFRRALAVTRANPVAHMQLGTAFLRQGRIEPAVAELTESIRLAPSYVEAHNNLGNALAVSGRLEEAAAQFRIASRLIDQPEFHHNLAATLDKLGRPDEAIPEYEAALRRDPDRYLTLMMLARDLAARGRLAEAEADLRHALDLDHGAVETRRLLAMTLTLRGRVEEAIAEYREILKRSPDDIDALNNIAWIRATHAEAAHRDGAEAVRLAERARDLSPTPEPVLYSTLAAAYAEAGRFPEAVKSCERAIALARAAGDARSSENFAEQLRCYRAGRPFHFAK